MKRTDLLKKLNSLGCELSRHGSRHDVYKNPKTGKVQPIPRHTEIAETLAKHIIKILQ